jgi:uncharacterized protein YfaS (alpha-2-macroglobulin family)
MDRTSNSTTASFVIKEDWIPGITVSVEAVGEAPRANDAGVPDATKPSRPAFASGTVSLDIPASWNGITVAVTPREESQNAVPGASVTVRVAATNRDGKPVAGAEVGIVMVDESVLSLTGIISSA